ncbi:outer membrane beta-barrel protein [Spongiibacter tropicus]|uniref:outer membrane beta-barrel protein n=1 Tax=Spongiibacter tropicus TaxID=454602 RepID=UPI0003B4607E|nr:outer membrane beta-barrel protein [Spongiibacter tropicus]
MKYSVLSASALVLALSVPTAQASPYRSSSPSMYVFGGVGMSDFSWQERDVRYSFGDGSLSDVEVDEQSSAARIGFGLPVGESLAFEMGYVNLGDLTASGFSDGSQVLNNGYSAGRVDIDGSLDALFIGLRLQTPAKEPIGLYARMGIAAWEFDGRVEDSSRRGEFLVEGSDPYLGAGMRLAVARNADIQVGYDYYVFDDDRSIDMSADVVSVDFVLRF